MLDFSTGLSSGREPLFNVGNLTGKSYHEITHFKRMGLNDLSSNSLILTKEYAFRGRERNSLLVHAHYHALVYSLFFLFNSFSSF